jgi:hypothetical protein
MLLLSEDKGRISKRCQTKNTSFIKISLTPVSKMIPTTFPKVKVDKDRVEIICRVREWKGTLEKRNWIKDLVGIQSKEPRRRNHSPGGDMSPNPALEVFSDYV